MTFDAMDETARQFLNRLFEQTEGQSSRQVSMYDVGAALGWDRDAASQAAQDLMAAGLVEVRTLSGGIGISAEGAAVAQSALGSGGPGANMVRLGSNRIVDKAACQAVERVCDDIKAQAGSLGLDFDTLAEVMADLKTIADQLGSSRPKTAIIREGLRSLEGVLKQFAGNRSLASVRALIGD
jgi:ABC-type sugar transport system substrate-binding protein